MGYIIDKSKKKATNNTSKSYIIGKLNPSWEEKQKTIETQKLSNNQKIVSSYEPPKNYEVIPNLLPQSPKSTSTNNTFMTNVLKTPVLDPDILNLTKPKTVSAPTLNQNLDNYNAIKNVEKFSSKVNDKPLINAFKNLPLATQNYYLKYKDADTKDKTVISNIGKIVNTLQGQADKSTPANFWDKFSSTLRKTAFGEDLQTQDYKKSTGSGVKDVLANIGGTAAGFGVPSGSGGSAMTLFNKVGEKVAEKVTPKITSIIGSKVSGNLLPKILTKGAINATRGAAEGLGTGVYENVVTPNMTAEERIKSLGLNTLMGAGIGGAIGAASPIVSKAIPVLKSNIIGDNPLPNILNKVQEFAEKQRYLAEKMPSIQNYIDTAGKQPKTLSIKPKTIRDINTIKPNKSIPESKIKPNYDTPSKGLLNNQTGGVKNIFGVERSTKEFTPVASETASKIMDKPKYKSSGLYDSIKTKFFNSQNTLGTKGFKASFGDMPEKLASNTSNNRNIVSHVLESKLVNKDGIPIADSFKSIMDDIPKKSQTMVEDYLLHKHNISRMEQNKPIFGNDVTSEISKTKVAEYEAAVPELKEISTKLNNWMNTFMETWGVDTGLVSRDTWTKLKEVYPDYVPTYRIFDEVESFGKGIGSSKGFADTSKIIKAAKGSERNIQSPLSKITELVDNTIRASKDNQVMQNIVDTMKANPESTAEWGRIIQQPKNELIENINKTLEESGIEGVIKEFANQYDTVFSKSKLDKANVVRVMVNGEPVYVEIKDPNFLKAVTGLTTSKTTDAEKVGRAMTGWFKGLITGYNPIFTVKNIARDLPTAYINGVESNPAKFLLDIKDAVKEIKNNGKMWQEYKGMGGGGGGFFQADKTLDRKLYGNVLDRAKSGIEKVNTITEQMPRFAEYMKIAKKYGNTAEGKVRGLFAANDLTVNFSRKGGSDIVRIADAFTPYLNAGLQGIDKLFRQLTTSPSQFFKTIGKSGFVISTPTVGFYMINKDNPNYQQLDNRTKDTYFCIPNMLDKDENGNAKTFIKIPKTREYGAIFGALFERGLRQAFGEKDSYKGIGNTIATNFAPANPITDSIAAPIINLRANKDFAGRTIVPQSLQNRSPELQYDEQSTELSKKIGKLGISPKQIDYLINSYSGVVGQIAMPIMQNKSTAVSAPTDILKKNFVADPLYSNQLSKDFYENKKQLETKRSDYKALNPDSKKKYKDLTLTKVTKDADKAGDLYDKIRTLDPVKDKEQIKKLRTDINTIFSKANKQMNP